jgi:chitodextrinase
VNVTGSVVIPNTGGWNLFQWVGKKGVALTAGQHKLKVVSDQQYFNLNSARVIATVDATPPTVSITTPSSGAAATGTMTVSANAADNTGVAGVQFKYNGTNIGAEVTTPPYTVTANTTAWAAGTHTLTAVARDVAGNVTTSAAVTVTKGAATPDTAAPSVPIGLTATYIAPNQVRLAWNASTDNVAVTGYYIYVNDAPLTTTTATTFTVNGAVAGTTYTYRVSAYDAVPNHSTWTASPVAITVPGAPAPLAGTVAWSCDFLNSTTDCGFGEQAKVAGRATLLASGGRNGGKAVRLNTQPGDNNVAGSGSYERNDLTLNQSSTDCYEGRDQWWGHSVMFPLDYIDLPMSTATSWNDGLVFDFHNSNPGAGQANFQILTYPLTALSIDRPTGLGFQVAYGDQFNPTKYYVAVGPIVRNVWYDFVYHVKWSSGADGYFDAWVNGVKKMSYRGPTLYAGQGCYLKLANYHAAFGQAQSVIHSRIIRGTTADAVALTPLLP